MTTKKLYISKNIFSTDFIKVIQFFNNEDVHTINSSNSYNFYINPKDGVVYNNKDPRIASLFGLNNFKTNKKEKKSFVTIQYNKSDDLYTAKRFLFDVLHQEVVFDSDLAIISYLNHNFPKKPKEKTLHVSFVYNDSTIIIEKIMPSHKNNEYYRKIINIENGLITLEQRKNEKNDWYTLSTAYYDLFDAKKLLQHVPIFDIDKFYAGQIIL